ncbi:hypothetical protein NPIL_356821 [Nephila pilipes]|uniref:Uncharacterized protein n=1 Tax=Nephila pilipes TaxID=299642 RepID=A0A8X6T5P5_NEPPI|nr:hypothetical protein NPIL_196911 [Nephila pilipes]GFU41257.1 hypothetical protein NPIL_356821 [Nephila pilipes]
MSWVLGPILWDPMPMVLYSTHPSQVFEVPSQVYYKGQYGFKPSFGTKTPNDTRFKFLDREFEGAPFYTQIVCLEWFGEFWSMCKISRVFSGVWGPWRPFYGTEAHNLGIVGIVSSAGVVGGVARVDRSHRSQSSISQPGVWSPHGPSKRRQDWNEVGCERAFQYE